MRKNYQLAVVTIQYMLPQNYCSLRLRGVMHARLMQIVTCKKTPCSSGHLYIVRLKETLGLGEEFTERVSYSQAKVNEPTS